MFAAMLGHDRFDSEPAEAKLVRRFSEQWSHETPDGHLQRSLGAKIAFDEEFARHERGLPFPQGTDFVKSDEIAMVEARARLEKAWEKFHKKLPKKQQQQQQQQMTLGETPPLEYVFQAVNNAAQTWESNSAAKGSGRAKIKFRDLCGRLNNHKEIFSLFPKEDKYFTIFTGTLTTIVQAAVNHSEITEQVGLALGDLGDDIDFWHRHQHEIDSERLRRFIIEFYVVVFEFFTEIFVQWSRSSRTRFWTSLNSNAVTDLFTSKRERIRNIQHKVQREIEAESRRRARQKQHYDSIIQHATLQKLHRMEGTLSDLLQAYRTPIGLCSFTNELEAVLGHDAQKLLMGCATHEIDRSRSRSPLPSPRIGSATQEETSQFDRSRTMETPAERQSTPAAPDLVSNLRSLRTRVAQHLQAVSNMLSYISRLDMDAKTQRRIIAWADSRDCEALWIEGPSTAARPSQNTATALILTAFLRRTKTPYVQYFTSLAKQPDRDFSYAEGLREMVSCIIMQLIVIASEQAGADLSFLQDHLRSLDEGTISFNDALSLLRSIRRQIQEPVALVIDCFQDLEQRADEQYMGVLLRMLGEFCSWGDKASRESSTGSITKICFTTDGYMAALGTAAAEDLLSHVVYSCEADDRMADETLGFQ